MKSRQDLINEAVAEQLEEDRRQEKINLIVDAIQDLRTELSAIEAGHRPQSKWETELRKDIAEQLKAKRNETSISN